ncbi:MAG: hypothetical protein JWO92_679 [Chitinophagaceae bacterium]|nr:hypothetical protein [Chitinophagaceae bacterium]MDB5222388.1 hypothetical protein [Chitinophagaceae bacterium]
MDKSKNWKAWVDTMPLQKGGKLYVHGDIKVSDIKIKYSVIRSEPQGINPVILLLEVQPKPDAGDNSFHLEYHEQLQDPTKYTQITIQVPPDETVDVEQVS